MTRVVEYNQKYYNISIHMPHTWHDRCEGLRVVWAVHFNPHATYVA